MQSQQWWYLPVDLLFMVYLLQFPVVEMMNHFWSETRQNKQRAHTLWSGQGFSAFIDIKNTKVQ